MSADGERVMRAAVLERFGSPEVYVTRTFPIPSPGQGEAVVKVRACGICGEEGLARRGEIPSYARRMPLIQGHEFAGEVVEVGAAVAEISVGDIVVVPQVRPCHNCEQCHDGRETLCARGRSYGMDVSGGYGEYCLIDAAEAVRIPASVDPVAATVAACAVAVSVHAFRLAHLRAGQRCVVTGAGGGVGVHALQVARSYGAHVTAVTSSAEKRRILEQFADEVVGAETMVKDLARLGTRPGIVLELTSGISFERSIRAVARGGTVVLLGNLSPRPVELATGAMIMRETTVCGSSGATRLDVVEAVRLISQGEVKPVIASVLPAERVAEAHRQLESGTALGRIVITHA